MTCFPCILTQNKILTTSNAIKLTEQNYLFMSEVIWVPSSQHWYSDQKFLDYLLGSTWLSTAFFLHSGRFLTKEVEGFSSWQIEFNRSHFEISGHYTIPQWQSATQKRGVAYGKSALYEGSISLSKLNKTYDEYIQKHSGRKAQHRY